MCFWLTWGVNSTGHFSSFLWGPPGPGQHPVRVLILVHAGLRLLSEPCGNQWLSLVSYKYEKVDPRQRFFIRLIDWFTGYGGFRCPAGVSLVAARGVSSRF